MRGSRTQGQNIDLGLAVSELSLLPGQTRTHAELAAFCGCTRGNIFHIEQRALHKLKKAWAMNRSETLIEIGKR